MNNLIVFKLPSLPAPFFQWRDRGGRYHLVAKMETRNLFFTLRMIWNNFLPAEMRVGEVNLYTFNQRYYNDKYIADAIVYIGHELAKRTDIEPVWEAQLEEMASWYNKRPLQISYTYALEEERGN